MPESYPNNNLRQPLEEIYKVPMEEETLMSLSDYLEILNRRKWSLIIPTISIFLIAAMLALILQAIYKSTATILIEEQQIPSGASDVSDNTWR